MDKESETNSEVQCLNCGSPVLGRFCQECGQASSTERYRFASLGRELYDQLRKIDASTTARTFFSLLRDPGTFVRDYLSGKRVGFLGPIKYFFYSFVVQVLLGGMVFWLTHDRTFSSTSATDLRFEIVSLISTVFWGLLWALFYRKSELNTVENVVAAIYFVAQVNFVAFFVQLVAFPFARFATGLRDYLGLLDILITVGYSFYFARSLFSERLVLFDNGRVLLLLRPVTFQRATRVTRTETAYSHRLVCRSVADHAFWRRDAPNFNRQCRNGRMSPVRCGKGSITAPSSTDFRPQALCLLRDI